MDFDKLSLKEQLEIKIFQFESYIQECESQNEYFDKCIVNRKNKAQEERNRKNGVPFGWELSEAIFFDLKTAWKDRISYYKDKIYKLKDELYNLKEHENMVSS